SSERSASKTRAWIALESSAGADGPPPNSGSSSASAARVPGGIVSAMSVQRAARSRASGRSASTSGAYGIEVPLSSWQWPRNASRLGRGVYELLRDRRGDDGGGMHVGLTPSNLLTLRRSSYG